MTTGLTAHHEHGQATTSSAAVVDSSAAEEALEVPADEAVEGVERTLMVSFLGLRAVHVGQAAFTVVNGWRAYRRPQIALAAFVGAAGTSAVLARMAVREGRLTPRIGRIDVASSIITTALLQSAVDEVDRLTGLNWMFSYGVGSAVGAAMSFEQPESASAAIGLATAYAVLVRPPGGRLSLRTDRFVNITLYAGFYGVARAVVGLLRRTAAELDRTRAEAVSHSRRLAAEQERNRHHRLLHDAALQTLEAVASGWADDPSAVTNRARQDAARLRSVLDGTIDAPGDLVAALDELRARAASQGVQVELLTAELRVDPAAPLVEALRDATGEALANVGKHSGSPRAVVRASSTPTGVEITVRDHGVGFDPSQQEAGFGISESIVARLHEVGGNADVWSAPERGTRVRLWAPVQVPVP